MRIPLLLFCVITASISLASALKCYSCTNYDSENFKLEVKSQSWAKWLKTILPLTRSPVCVDEFDPDPTVRAHAKNCDGGLCIKVKVTNDTNSHVLRTCLMKAAGQFKEECVEETTSKGNLKICTCATDHCNAATPTISFSKFQAKLTIAIVLIAGFSTFFVRSV